ncbi:MAG: hypothetical protein HY721_10440 [Planctomycetes bacterium]|nr:hypothetical protein [Planctomycetota bacterium]
MDELTFTPLPYPEPTRRSVGEVLLELGFAEDLDEGERLAARLFPDLPGEITRED